MLQNEEPRSAKERGLIQLVALLLLSFVAWVPSVATDQWTADDQEVVLQSPVVKGAVKVADAFKRDYTEHLGSSGQWRPLSALSLRLDFALFGPLSSTPWHYSNLLLHVITVAAAWRLSRCFRPDGLTLGVLFFSLHPILSNSISWVSGRPAMLCVLLGLLGANLHSWVLSKRLGPGAQAASVFIAASLPLLAKEDGVLFALVLLYLTVKSDSGSRIASAVGLLASVLAWLFSRSIALGVITFNAHPVLSDSNLYERISVGLRAAGEALAITVMPFQFSPRYELETLPSLGFALTILTALSLVAAFCIKRRAWAPMLFLAPAIAFAPFMQIVPAGEVFAPRFVHIALLFTVPLADRALRAAPKYLPWAIFAALTIGSWRATGHYASAESYWSAAVAANPRSAASFNALGLVRQDQGEHDAALQLFERSLTLEPSHSRAWTNTARSLYSMGDMEGATTALRQAVKTGPKNPIAHINWGRHLQRLDEHRAAKSAYLRAIELSPGMPEAWSGLAATCSALGEEQEAQDARDRAEHISPTSASKP